MTMPISTNAAFFRPMYCARMPSGKRISAPAKMGTEIMKPFWAAVRLKVSEMKGAMAPFNTQTAKQKSKYKNAANNVGAWPLFRNVLNPAMVPVLYKTKQVNS